MIRSHPRVVCSPLAATMDLLYILNSVSKPAQQTESLRAPSARVLSVKGQVLDVHFSEVEQISSNASRDVETADRRRCTKLTASRFLPKSAVSIQRISELRKCWITAWAPFQFKAKLAKSWDLDRNPNVLKSAGMSKSLGARENLWSSDCNSAQGAPIANSSVVKDGPKEGQEHKHIGKAAGMEFKDICG